jgi:hypothetical protein
MYWNMVIRVLNAYLAGADGCLYQMCDVNTLQECITDVNKDEKDFHFPLPQKL